MAKYLKLNEDQYGVDGMVRLYRGDDWALSAKIVDLTQGLESAVDLTGLIAASAFFPGALGFIQATWTVVDAPKGLVTISMAASGTPAVDLNTDGISPLVVLQEPTGLQTLVATDQPIVVQDRSWAV